MRSSATEDFSCLRNRHWHGCKRCRGMQGNCLPSAVYSALQGVSPTLPTHGQLSVTAFTILPCVKGCECKITNYCLDRKEISVQFCKAFLEGPSLMFHGQCCSHVVLCSCLIECSWGNSLVDFLIMSPLSFPWFCLVLIFKHCPAYAGCSYLYLHICCPLYPFLRFSCIHHLCSSLTHSLWKHQLLSISILMQLSWTHSGLKIHPLPPPVVYLSACEDTSGF